MFAEQQYKLEAADLASRLAVILPSVDISETVHWYEPNGSTRTGQIQSIEVIGEDVWAAALYEQLPGVWILENRHAFNFFSGVGPEFLLQIGQAVWFQSDDKWQAATIAAFSLECGEWFATLEYQIWYGIVQDEKPLCEVRTTKPELVDDIEYSAWCDDRNDSAYEDARDNR